MKNSKSQESPSHSKENPQENMNPQSPKNQMSGKPVKGSQFHELTYTFESKRMDLSNDEFINYIDEGNSSEVLLFVHGLGSYIPAWKKNIEVLKSQFRCIAIDLPGYGRSSAGVHEGTMDFYSGAIAEFISKLGIKKVNLIGHSMGGHITICTVLKYPELIKKLILVSPAGFETFTDEETDWLKRNFTPDMVASGDEKQVRINFLRNFYNMPEDAVEMIKDRIGMITSQNFMNYCRVVVNSFYGMLDNPVLDKLKNISCPVLILFGKKDQLIPHPYIHREMTPGEVAKTGAEKIPDSKLILLDNCGHFLQFEKPEEFNREVKKFILIN